MLFSVFLLLFIFGDFYLYEIHSANVTFVPTPIEINIADLPQPFETDHFVTSVTILPVPSDPKLSIPEGFSIKLYMSDLECPRLLLYTPAGDILVSEPDINRISCLLDTDKDGFPDQRLTLADASNGLNGPDGLAFANGYLYVGNNGEIRRYEWDPSHCHISGNGTRVMQLLVSFHGRRHIVIPTSNDKIYITIGSESDSDPDDPPLGAVQQANIDGSNVITFASGIRNPSGITIHPITQDVYVTCNERNELGDDLVPDFFTRIQQDDFFGWPYAYLSANLTDPKRLKNGTSERPDLVARTKTPGVLFHAHSSPLDIKFYTGKQFPERYRNGAFVAIHGSQSRSVATGYKVCFIPFDHATNRPIGYYEDFVTGFLLDPNTTTAFGRPAGLLVLKDGSLIFSDSRNGRIYQVQYNNAPNSYSLAMIIFLIVCNYLSIIIAS